jgi:hypothetical protein
MNSLDTLKEDLRTYAVVIVVPIVLILCVIAVRGYFSASEEKTQIEGEVESLRKQVDTYNSNKQLVQSDLDLYNNLLLSVIPNREDFFSMILALEKISQETGFNIDKYTIQLTDSTPEKLALSVEGTGDSNSFLKFLQQYRYKGGRLITNEKMEFSTANVGQTKLSLNFYNKASGLSDQKVEAISTADVNLIKDIQNKVSLSFTDNNEEVDTNYQTKENPF